MFRVEHVKYCPESPSGLLWNTVVLSGRDGTREMTQPGQVAGAYAGTDRGGRYWKFQFQGVKFLCHRIIWEMFNGPAPEGMVVDHKDRNTRNNLLTNLRLVPVELNNKNRGKFYNNTSGIPGVHQKTQNGYVGWTASWSDLNGKRRSKYFSSNKYGSAAFDLACEFRNTKATEANNYTKLKE